MNIFPFWKKKGKVAPGSGGEKIQLDLSHAKVACPKCKTVHTGNDIWNRYYICPNCGKYMPVGARERLLIVLDEGTFEPWFEEVGICDPLKTPGYPEKLAAAQAKSGNTEAVTIR